MPEVNARLYQFLNQRLRHEFPAFDRNTIISAMTSAGKLKSLRQPAATGRTFAISSQ
jgi:hypothetical protein